MACKRLVQAQAHTHLTATQPPCHVFRAVIERVRDHKESTVPIRRLTLRALGFEHDPSAVFTYKAGQWVDFIIPNVDSVGEFSFISSPEEVPPGSECSSLPWFDLAVQKSAHPSAAWVHSDQCHAGAEVEVRVGGEFTVDLLKKHQTPPKILCYIAGVCITY